MKKEKLHKIFVSITSVNEVLSVIENWINLPWKERSAHNICLANVHMCMEAIDCSEYRSIINDADLVLMDGKPLSVFMKLLGYKNSIQIRGEDITYKLCEFASENNYSIGFYGSTLDNLSKLETQVRIKYPNIKIKFLESPPFKVLNETENEYYLNKINEQEIDILFIGLGCPKQENWMHVNKTKINSVLLGVGAAFDFISRNKKNAPIIVKRLGLEWLFRLISEPKRLWKRYLKHNPRFLYISLKEIIRRKCV